jgi:hypothetical protein
MTSGLIIVAFILGAITGVYFLKLGMEWQSKLMPKDGLPLNPLEGLKLCNPDAIQAAKKEIEEEKPHDKTLQHWFAGGEK